MSIHIQQARAALKGKAASGPEAALWSRIGFWAAVSTIQIFVCEFIVSATWRGLYSYRANFISELGVSFCGPTGNWPCSSLYPLMNVSIALVGVSLVVAALAWMVTGAVDSRGGILLTVAGGGAMIAGVINQSLDYALHSVGATVMFFVGSLAMIVCGGHRTLRLPVAVTVTALGWIGLAASLLFIGGHDLGIGIGAVERVIVYAIVAGAVVLAVAHRSTARRATAENRTTTDSKTDEET